MVYVYSESWSQILGMAIVLTVTLGLPALLYICLVFGLDVPKIARKKKGTLLTDENQLLEISPVIITAKSIVYTVPLKKSKNEDGTPGPTRKTILNNVNACFRPGSLSAIMGPSGCGKTTFLNILADRQPVGGVVKGEIRVNGAHRGPYYKRQAAYVMQFDALFPFLTVREHLTYVASLRLERSVDAEKKERTIEEVISLVSLDGVADQRIGDATTRGLSGGQKRRVTVATELVTMPSVLYLDEPTTGLDAYSSLSLVRSLRVLADGGQTIVCTIHQPRPDIFELFTNLLLMKSGEVGYFGTVTHMPRYLSGMGITIPPDVNSADFVVDMTYDREQENPKPKQIHEEKLGALNRLASKLTRTVTMSSISEKPTRQDAEGRADSIKSRELASNEQSQCNAEDLIPYFTKSAERVELLRDIDSIHSGLDTSTQEYKSNEDISVEPRSSVYTGFVKSKYATTTLHQLGILVRRDFTNMLRSPATRFSYGIIIVQFLFYGVLFLGTRTENPTADQLVRTRSAFFFQIMNTVTLLEVDVISIVWLARTVFYREHASGAYSVVSYHLLWLCRLSFFAIVKAILYTMIIYWFPLITITAGRVFVFLCVVAVLSSVGSSLALLLVCAIPEVEGAGAIHSTIAGMMGTFAGFFIPPNILPVFLIWLYYMSFYKYSYEALNENQYQDDTIVVGNNTVQIIGELIKVDETLNRFTNIVVLCFYPIIFHAVAILATWAFTHKAAFITLFSFGKKNHPVIQNRSEEPTISAVTHAVPATIQEIYASHVDLTNTPTPAPEHLTPT
eukprot:CFRG4114T1